MASGSSLEDKVRGQFYMNKIFGRGMEHVRALERDAKGGKALGSVRRVTIEPQYGGRHRVVVERSAVVEHAGHGFPASADRIGSSLSSEHSFRSAGDAVHFLNDVLTDHSPAPSADDGEAGRFLDQVLSENGGD